MTTSGRAVVALVAAVVTVLVAAPARAGGVTTTSTTLVTTTSTTVTSTTSTTESTTTSSTSTTSTSSSSTSLATTSTTSTSSSTTSSTSTSSSTTSSTSTTTLPVPEACGNCLDDDGNGLTDFEDPACCGGSAPAVTTIELLRILPGVAASRLSLSLAPLPMVAISPATNTVFVQLVPADGAPAFCASVDAVHFRARGSKASFRDTTMGVPSARGVSSMKLRQLTSGNVRLTLAGRAVALPTPNAQALRVAVALRALTEVGNPTRCVARSVGATATSAGSLALR